MCNLIKKFSILSALISTFIQLDVLSIYVQKITQLETISYQIKQNRLQSSGKNVMIILQN